MKQFFLVLLFLAASTAAAQIHFTAILTGSDEVPSVTTTANGTGSFVLSDDFSELAYVITYQGLSGTLSAGGHFHTGTPGRTGPVVRTTATSGGPASNTVSGIWKSSDATQPLTPALVESLLTGRVYVNFHTTANPGGEIRGQVTLATALQFTADLSGSQENPAVATTAAGTGYFVLSTDRTTLDYAVTYRDLSGTLTAGGHFHAAGVGNNGPVVRAIGVSGDPASNSLKGQWKATDGTQPLTPALVDSLVAGKIYVNFHTASHPGGEIRGQLNLAGGTGFAAQLEANQEVPPNAENGTGTGYILLNAPRTSARYAITYINLTGTLTAGGHFHTGTAGRNGPVVRSIASSGGPASGTVFGTWNASDVSQPLTAALAESLLSGRLYVNFHTAAHPGGEIRGQVSMTTGRGFTIALDGTREVPPNASTGLGSGFAVVSAELHDVRYGFTYFGLAGTLTAGGHFHTAPAGVNGPVVKGIASSGMPAAASVNGNWSTNDATQPLTSALVDSILAGKLYVNFHTATYPGGEIRGQVESSSGSSPTGVGESHTAPATFALRQNYPNPFNPSTTITFDVAKEGRMTLKIFNVLGQEVATILDQTTAPGTHAVRLDGRGLPSGMYIYRLQSSAGDVQSRSMVLLK
jgi:hypothetical protein